jgi:hypothetical protein
MCREGGILLHGNPELCRRASDGGSEGVTRALGARHCISCGFHCGVSYMRVWYKREALWFAASSNHSAEMARDATNPRLWGSGQ